jgi:large subunit ribosomal protein L18
VKECAGGRPRISIFRSGRYIYAQLIDDARHCTLASASSIEKEGRAALKSTNNIEAAKWVGQKLAERAVKAGVDKVVFDRGSYLFHGRVKALADAAREGGLTF